MRAIPNALDKMVGEKAVAKNFGLPVVVKVCVLNSEDEDAINRLG